MTWWLLLIFLLVSLVVLIVMRTRVAYAILGINILLGLFLFGVENTATQLVVGGISGLASFSLLPVPLFILLGSLLTFSGVADDALQTVDYLFGRVKARLPLIAVASGALLGILSGSAMASTAILGKGLLPKMVKSGYQDRLSVGSIVGAGGLAMVIPPSAMAVVLGAVGNISIGKLLLGGLLPGILMAISYVLIITIWATFFKAAPPKGEEHVTKVNSREALLLTFKHIAPLSIIVFAVLGLILLGYATPSESAALGVVAAAFLGVFKTRGSLKFVWFALLESTKITASIFIILLASSLYSKMLSFSGASRSLVKSIIGLDVNPYIVLLFMQLVVLFFGMFLEQISIMLVTLPLFMPVVLSYGWDPVWFGVIMLINIQIAGISPPFGLNLFVMKGVAPPRIKMSEIYLGAIPFVASDIVTMALIALFPAIALWVPSLM